MRRVAERRTVDQDVAAVGDVHHVGAQVLSRPGPVRSRRVCALPERGHEGRSLHRLARGPPLAPVRRDDAAPGEEPPPLGRGELVLLREDPRVAGAVEDTLAGDRETLLAVGGDRGHHAVLARAGVARDDREVLEAAAERHERPAVEVQVDPALELDRPGAPHPRRHDHVPAPGLDAVGDRRCERLRVERHAVGHGPVVGDAEDAVREDGRERRRHGERQVRHHVSGDRAGVGREVPRRRRRPREGGHRREGDRGPKRSVHAHDPLRGPHRSSGIRPGVPLRILSTTGFVGLSPPSNGPGPGM